jgi:nucleotide-binding universal stress UspA family protein
MTAKILVGYDGSPQSEDALHLAKGLGAITGASLVVTDVEFGSSAQALREMAEADSDDLIVVAGTLGIRLLDGAPCPVAIAPHGLADAGPWRPSTIGVAFDGSPEAHAALDEARQIALAARATLAVIAVAELIGSPHQTVDPADYRRESEQQAQEWLREARAALRGDFTVVTRTLVGDPGPELLEFGHRLDLLVLGSRGYGPVRRVLFGSVSAHLIARCTCPLIVTPRGTNVSPGFRRRVAQATA